MATRRLASSFSCSQEEKYGRSGNRLKVWEREKHNLNSSRDSNEAMKKSVAEAEDKTALSAGWREGATASHAHPNKM